MCIIVPDADFVAFFNKSPINSSPSVSTALAFHAADANKDGVLDASEHAALAAAPASVSAQPPPSAPQAPASAQAPSDALSGMAMLKLIKLMAKDATAAGTPIPDDTLRALKVSTLTLY